MLFVVVVVLLMVPFAAAYGTATFTRLDAQARADRAASQQIPAVLMEDSLPGVAAVANRSHHTGSHAQAQWGTEHGAHRRCPGSDGGAGRGDGQRVDRWEWGTRPRTGVGYRDRRHRGEHRDRGLGGRCHRRRRCALRCACGHHTTPAGALGRRVE
uniref:hypothetical protein n=1 Tax=Rhodococcus opacus TaxID=37919 RepID=UPI003F656BC7